MVFVLALGFVVVVIVPEDFIVVVVVAGAAVVVVLDAPANEMFIVADSV